MSDLVSRLLAAIDEVEQVARNCSGAPWVDQVPGMVHVDPAAIRDAKWQFGKLGYVATVEHDHDRAHIARNDPAATLRLCQAHRDIVADYQAAQERLDRFPEADKTPLRSAYLMVRGYAMAMRKPVQRLARGYGVEDGESGDE